MRLQHFVVLLCLFFCLTDCFEKKLFYTVQKKASVDRLLLLAVKNSIECTTLRVLEAKI